MNDQNLNSRPPQSADDNAGSTDLVSPGNLASPNERPRELIRAATEDPWGKVIRRQIAGADVLDCGVDTRGSLELGLMMAHVCGGGLLRTAVVPCDSQRLAVGNAIQVQTDNPLMACLGCQYAGWPVKSEDYFAMGSGPARLLRGKEEVLKEFQLGDPAAGKVCVVLESDTLPTESAIELIAQECGKQTGDLIVLVAPSTCIAGSVQVVARSVETAMHKLHSLKFEVDSIVSATGVAPLPPPAKPGKSMTGIGRTNDAMLYGAEVTLWAVSDDEAVKAVIDRVPSQSSEAHGKPFEEIFAEHNHDFYAVDPGLFSPAVVTIHNLASGNTFSAGNVLTEVLRRSFGT